MTDKPITSIEQWKRSVEGVPVELPSGNVVKLRRPGLDTFVQAGQVPNSLMSLMTSFRDSGKETPDYDAVGDEILNHPEKLQELMSFLDFAVTKIMVDPPVSAVPEDGEPRDPGKLYTDEVDLEDKFFMLNYAVGGVNDLAKFRQQLAPGVDAVQPRKTAAPKAKSARRGKK